MEKIVFTRQFELARKVDNKDKYFIVKVLDSKNAKMEIGWIDKEFNHDKFKRASGMVAISFKEFENKEDYEIEKKQYKINKKKPQHGKQPNYISTKSSYQTPTSRSWKTSLKTH